MSHEKVRGLIKFYLPHLITAGDYALAIQKDIAVHKAKGVEYSGLGQFLTDADLSVENFLEVITLASGQNVDFEGEEAEKSLNRKYFQKKIDPEFKIWVDPINGTFLYKDGMDGFDIIITIVDPKTKKIVGVIDYIPAKDIFFVGIKDLGAFSFKSLDLAAIDGPANYKIQPNDGPISLYHIKEPFAGKLKTIRTCLDMDYDYQPIKGKDFCICSILTGDIISYVKPKGKLIDWGAIAFIVEQAGGVVTDFSGQPIPNYLDFPKHRIPSLLVSTSADIHQKILEQMNGYPTN
jgi:myo-inositol-1(or 4)-monophosphatase